MSKILLIGGNGYVGTRLYKYLLNTSAKMIDVMDTCWFGKSIEGTIVEDY